MRRPIAIALAVITLSCYDGVTGPGNQPPADVSVTVMLPAATPAIWYPRGESLHLTVRRAGRTDAIVDTARTIADSLRMALTVPLAQSVERFVATGEVRFADQVYFLAFDVVQLRAGVDTAITLVADYVGPGANAAAFTLVARDTALRRSDTTRVVPHVTDSLDRTIPNVPVRFQSGRPAVLAVDTGGVVEAITGGRDTASIAAYLPMGLSSATRLSVVPTPTTLAVLSGNGQRGEPTVALSDSLVVKLTDELRQPLPAIAVHFATDAGSGTVRPVDVLTDAAGRAATQWTLGAAAGGQGVTASVEGRLTARFTATAASGAVAAVVVSPAAATLTRVGATRQLTAVATTGLGDTLPGAMFAWSSSDSAIVTVDASGLVTVHRNGSATITATTDTVSGTAQVTGSIAVATVAVSPDSATLTGLDSTQRFNADARDSGGTPIPGITFAWSSSDTTVATVDAQGLATSVGLGTATIKAASGAVFDTATLTVTGAACAQCMFVFVDGDGQTAPASSTLPVLLTAQIQDPLERVVPGVAVTFTPDGGDGSVTPITVLSDASGYASTRWTLGPGIGPQHVTVSATGAASGVFSATALGAVRSVAVTPTPDTLGALDATVQLTAQAFDSAGGLVSGKTFTWTTSDAGIATVDATGLVTAVANGTATITATSDYVSGGATIVVKTGPFTSVTAMASPRRSHTATLLPDGTVLIAGGIADASASVVLTTAEIFHPSTGTFTAASGAMASPRVFHSATLLPSGQVLIVGGDTSEAIGVAYPQTATTELFDPATGLFSPGDSLVLIGSPRCLGRSKHTATALTGGNVLIAGGSGTAESQLFVCAVPQEEYDGTSGGFTVTNTTALGTDHTATLLQNGKVLIVGGTASASGAWLYDPTTGTLTATGSLNTPRRDHTATLLPNGEVLIAGGWVNAPFTYPVLASAELYDPATGTFTPTGNMTAARAYHSAALLPNGTVLVAGGTSSSQSYSPLASAEIYDPATGQFTAIADMRDQRMQFQMTPLQDGHVLITGGLTFGGGVLASAELYTP